MAIENKSGLVKFVSEESTFAMPEDKFLDLMEHYDHKHEARYSSDDGSLYMAEMSGAVVVKVNMPSIPAPEAMLSDQGPQESHEQDYAASGFTDLILEYQDLEAVRRSINARKQPKEDMAAAALDEIFRSAAHDQAFGNLPPHMADYYDNEVRQIHRG